MASCISQNDSNIFPQGIGRNVRTRNELEFGAILDEIRCGSAIPLQLKTLMQVLYDHAPRSVHVFGVLPSVSKCVELKQGLQNGQVSWPSQSIYVCGAVFLNFLQHLPDPLLTGKLYPEWMDIVSTPRSLLSTKSCIVRLGKNLPRSHQELLKCFLVILRRMCQNVPRTHVTPILAGHFVGPSVLWMPNKKQFLHPSCDFHYKLAKIVKLLIVFMDDIWNDIDEKEMFGHPRAAPPSESGEILAGSEAFFHQNPQMLVDELEQESSHNSLLEEMMNSPSEYKPFRSPVTSALDKHSPPAHSRTLPIMSKISSRSSRTWPGYIRKLCELLSFGEGYLYPDWVYLYPAWNLPGDDLPNWALSGFTLDMNDLAEQTTDKWTNIFTNLFKEVLHPVKKLVPFHRHEALPGTQF
ncbi:uncharacterized protein LOC135394568 isoform X2 [Ornithodoros turicata]|uniref:uncharacterized protein LOC135394568 isoform X2 n=1 Tax=Ornithodoros turicata TaxID=34597 RepID=UPI0031397E6F